MKNHPRSLSRAWVRAVVLVGGIFYTLVGLALLFAPDWFFNTIGNFPPFNRHYMGDLGSFTLPMGVGLVFASRDPARHGFLIGAVVAANLLHAGNHVYDAILGNQPISRWMMDSVPLLVFGVVFAVSFWKMTRLKVEGFQLST
ncbi:MAG: hypothetical protein Fur0022_10280 [Anaerolineales bacterium]